MKKLLLILLFGACSFAYFSVESSLEQLKIKHEAAVNYIKTSMEFGTLSFPKTAKEIAAAAKAQIAVDMVSIAREYTQSPAFKQWYAEIRKAHEPNMPQQTITSPGPTAAELAQTRSQIEELQKKMATLPENERPAMQTYIDQLQKTANEQAGLNQQQRAAQPQTAVTDMAANQAYMNNVKLYNDSLINWKMVYPEDPTMIIKYRLQQYQTLLSTVDFSAQTTTDAKGITHFVNPDYEKKSGDWKRCYRAGKEANDAVQAPIRDWLSSLH